MLPCGPTSWGTKQGQQKIPAQQVEGKLGGVCVEQPRANPGPEQVREFACVYVC